MKRLIAFTAMYLFPTMVWAAFSRPTPQAQSATAEFWFFIASLCLIGALLSVAWIISKR